MSEARPESGLFSTDEAQEFRERWDAVQTEFVDEPRKSVIQRLSQIFTDERGKLETPIPLVPYATAVGLRGNAI